MLVSGINPHLAALTDVHRPTGSLKRTAPVDGAHDEASRTFKLTTELQMAVRVEDSWQHLLRQRRWCRPESLCQRVGLYAALPVSCLPSPPPGWEHMLCGPGSVLSKRLKCPKASIWCLLMALTL